MSWNDLLHRADEGRQEKSAQNRTNNCVWQHKCHGQFISSHATKLQLEPAPIRRIHGGTVFGFVWRGRYEARW